MTMTAEQPTMSQRDHLLEQEAAEARQLERDRQAFQISYATGEQVDFAEMRRVGLTVAQCDEWKERYLRRVEMADTMRKGLEAEATIKTTTKELKEVNAEFARVATPLQEKARRLDFIRAEAVNAMHAGNYARRDLISTATCPNALQKIAALEATIATGAQEQQRIQVDIKDKSGNLADIEALQPEAYSPKVSYEADIEALKNDIERLQARHDEIGREANSINDRVAAAMTEFLCQPEAIS